MAYGMSAKKDQTIAAITERYIAVIKWCIMETSNPNNTGLFPLGGFGNKQLTAPSS
jgi:hypothetical protein